MEKLTTLTMNEKTYGSFAGNLPQPATAAVGQVLVVAAVDDDGNVTEVEAVDQSSAPDGASVTFGYENDEPVEREEQYAIASADLNELGTITQKMSGKRVLMTVADMIYWLNRVQFIPQSSAESVLALNFAPTVIGTLPDVPRATVTSALALNFTSSAACAV